MGWTDGLSDSNFMMPWFGLGGIILFILVCLFTYCHHQEIMTDGTQMEVAAVGTCTRSECVIKVRRTEAQIEDPTLLEKTTSSKVFVGDLVMCGFKTCYKD